MYVGLRSDLGVYFQICVFCRVCISFLDAAWNLIQLLEAHIFSVSNVSIEYVFVIYPLGSWLIGFDQWYQWVVGLARVLYKRSKFVSFYKFPLKFDWGQWILHQIAYFLNNIYGNHKRNSVLTICEILLYWFLVKSCFYYYSGPFQWTTLVFNIS